MEATAAEAARTNGRPPDEEARDQSSLVTRLVRGVASQLQRRIPAADLDERDPDYIRENLPAAWLLSSLYFRGEVRGLGNIPEDGPVLLVGNHSGGNVTPDTTVFTLAYLRLLRRRAPLLPAGPQPGALDARPVLPAQVRHGGRLALQRPEGAVGRRRAARLPGRRLGGPPAHAGPQPGRLQPPQGVHPAGPRARRPARPRGVDRRPGDRAVPQPRRPPGAAVRPRPACSGSRSCRSRWPCPGG